MIATANRTMLALGFLARLRRLVEIRKNRENELNDKGIRLIENMIVRSYQDCLSVGAMREAQRIVEVLRG